MFYSPLISPVRYTELGKQMCKLHIKSKGLYNYFGESEEEEMEGKKITEGGEKRKETGQEKGREREGGRGRE